MRQRQALLWHSFCFWSPEDPNKDIQLYINSPGGMVTAGMAIYDTMQYTSVMCPSICIGLAASMGAFRSREEQRASAMRFRMRRS